MMIAILPFKFSDEFTSHTWNILQ